MTKGGIQFGPSFQESVFCILNQGIKNLFLNECIGLLTLHLPKLFKFPQLTSTTEGES